MSRFSNLLRRFGIQPGASTHGDVAGDGLLADVEFRIANMICEGCAEKIDGAFQSLAGVREIRSDVTHRWVLVRYPPTKVRPEQLKDAVNQAGFTAVEA